MKRIIKNLMGLCALLLLSTATALAQTATDVNCNGCVQSGDIATNGVRRADIQNFSVNTPKLNNFAVTTAKLGSAAVTEGKIADGAVTNAKLEDNHSLDASDGSPVDAVSVDTAGNVAMTGSLDVAGFQSNFRTLRTNELQVEPPGGFGQSGLIEIRNTVPWSRSIVVYDQNGTQVFNVELDGDVNGKSFSVLSDRRLKTNIQDIDEPLERVMDLRGVMFDWRNEDVASHDGSARHNIGFLAQEVGEVFPDAVKESHEGTLSVDYSSLVPVLVEAMKVQQRQIDRLTKDLEVLSGER